MLKKRLRRSKNILRSMHFFFFFVTKKQTKTLNRVSTSNFEGNLKKKFVNVLGSKENFVK